MKLLIDIPEDEYELVRHENKSYRTELVLMNAVAEGTPLPKGHGRLIDADNLLNQFPIWVDNVSSATINVTILKAPTIIDAESEAQE